MNSMMTNTSYPNETDDTTLVGCSLEGDVNAYGRLVERHQALACSVALGICGDIHQSEDIAQEAFMAAWKQLRDLREPDKFKSWICGIVRNLSHNSLRKAERLPAAETDKLSDESSEVDDAPSPAEQTINSEECAILMRQLQELPPLYREPMVLFYRQNESVASVAEVLGLSEDAVKQRLLRGRAMLAERIERTLGSVLRTTLPTTAFTLAVMGALAASTATASVAAVTGAGAKIAKGTALSGTLAAPILVGAAGMWSLFRSQTQSARTSREKRFAVWTLAAVTVLGFVVSFVVSLVFGMLGIRMMANSSGLVLLSFLIGVLVQSAGFAFGFWFYRRRQHIRLEDGMSAEAARSVWQMEPEDKGFWQGVIGFAVVLSSACNLPHIMVVLHWMKTLVIALPLVLAGLTIAALLRWPREWRRVLMALIVALFVQYAGLTAFMWQQWSQSKEAWQHSMAIIAIQSFYFGILSVTVIGCYLYWRWERWGRRAMAV